jgi:hypothetical protein
VGSIEPGEEFEIEYGNGHRIKVIALAGRKQGQLLKLGVEIQEAQQAGRVDECVDKTVEALGMCIGDIDKANTMFDTVLDFDLAGQIIEAATNKQAVDDADKKKLELPPSSEQEGSASHAA